MRPPHETLKVWQLAYAKALDICRLTDRWPSSVKYDVGSQLRRAALSIPANIAEGNARGSIKDYLHFCVIARGSLAEVRSFLRMALDLGHLSKADFEDLASKYDQVGKMLHFLMKALRQHGQ